MQNKFNLAFICLLIWIIPITLSGQRDINGRITDATDGQPIPAVTVFFSNTSVATTTDVDGNYRLQIPGEGSYRLTVSHVGYQPVTKDIEPGSQSITFDTALQPRELDELTVTEKVRTRRKDINLFWNILLGKSPSKRSIYAVNPEAVFYFFNAEKNVLTVSASEPLQIINNETGYQIQLILDHFRHDYNTELTSWKYEHRFTELTPNNNRQKTNWDTNRQHIYRVSMTNFIKSLYNNTLKDNGYVLTYAQRTDTDGRLRNTSENRNIFLTENINAECKTLYIPPELTDLILVCFGEAVNEVMLENINLAQDAYVKAFETRTSSVWMKNTQQLSTLQWTDVGLYRNVIETPTGPVCIYPDGTSNQPIKLSPFYSGSLSGLNMMLPIDYQSENTSDTSYPIDENSFTENLPASGFGNISTVADDTFRTFHELLAVFPQEKIHLHTDRDVYVPGEKIWFKAYLVDALNHLSATNSRYIYVELISPADSLINRVMIRPVDSLFFGYLPLTDIIPVGNYTLREYTKFMENMGDDYFFKKNIRIENLMSSNHNDTAFHSALDAGSPVPTKDQEIAGQARNDGDAKSLQNDFDVSFFPEGGNLPDGVMSKIAFKALNSNGYPENISGKLIDENGAEIAAVETFHAGMGLFGYVPKAGKSVFLKCRNIDGLEKRFELPRPDSLACALTVVRNNSRISVGVRTSMQHPDSLFYLLAHCRGEIFYFSEYDVASGSVSFAEEELPSGIIQFVLFDGQMNALSERLVFNKNDEDTGKVDFRTDKPVYGKREKVIVSLGIPKQTASSPLTGAETPSLSERVGVRCSVSVTDDKDNAVDSSTTILSTLLLSSELKGYIENPAWYLQDADESAYALDLLMMTHGWRRYNIPEVAKGHDEVPVIPFQSSQEITGRVKSMSFSKNVADSEISIVLPDGDIGLTSTDENGIFRVDGFEYPDSSAFFIYAQNSRGSNRVELLLDSVLFPKPIHAPFLETAHTTSPQTNDFIGKSEQRARYDEDMRMIYLDEVEVKARRIDRKEEERLRYWVNSSARYTIRKETIDKMRPQHVSDLLRNIPGLQGASSAVVTSFFTAVPPLVFIDGVEYRWIKGDIPPYEMVNVRDVESIDVIKQYSSFIFGGRASGMGVISITTKKGVENKNEVYNYTVYTPLGYQKPVEFYSPKYETLQDKQSALTDYRTTIYWKPDVVISDSGEASFDFYTSDFTTTYSVVIEGLTADGRIVRQVEKISVE
jgi:hypothetical protein